ncbi:hypothetical protein [Pedobacter sp. Hv1]|uniref:hypothetical protein n=1 Tax=Pedobacter sp. Hv1 TaxID=1740090 RepID=UPI0006D88A71|nr:hypothetical protein [Pedobacter sp. Hv1]KQB99851.1 hypothetical protein AQF98_15150 [Pedobacter sp. Hv1]
MRIEKENIVTYLGVIDLYLCSSGFESRSTYLGINLDKTQVKEAVIFHIEDTYKVSEDNLEEVKKNLPFLSRIDYPKNSPLETYDKFYQLFLKFSDTVSKDKYKVVIDMTTFTREVLLILIRLLSAELFLKYLEVIFVYTPAESYSDKDQNIWLTKGIRDIRSVLGFSGMQLPSKELLLILLSGFEEERADEIINSFEPNKLILGKASSKDSINEQLSQIANEKYKHLANNNSSILLDQFEFSCTNIKETQDQITSLYAKYGQQYNIVISPLNNKISTMGVAIAALKNDDIQICYASANQYNINAYSEGSNYFLTYNLQELIT